MEISPFISGWFEEKKLREATPPPIWDIREKILNRVAYMNFEQKPDAMLAVKTVLDTKGCLILSEDNAQLNPEFVAPLIEAVGPQNARQFCKDLFKLSLVTRKQINALDKNLLGAPIEAPVPKAVMYEENMEQPHPVHMRSEALHRILNRTDIDSELGQSGWGRFN